MQGNNNIKNGSGDSFSDWAVVILSILLFTRTADVLRYFSPKILDELAGTDVSWAYGIITAFFIEGVALAYHFNRKAQNYAPAKIVKWILLGISGVCQVFDGHIITGTLAQMSEAQKLIFQVGVPLLPLFVIVLLFGVGHLPETEPTPFKGIKHMFPDFHRLWEGEQQSTVLTQVPAKKVVINQLETPLVKENTNHKKNGKKAEEDAVNPT